MGPADVVRADDVSKAVDVDGPEDQVSRPEVAQRHPGLQAVQGGRTIGTLARHRVALPYDARRNGMDPKEL
jgi:hypothetical protein